MKKNLVRLLSILLAAVMVFPAAAFADDPVNASVKMYEGQTHEITAEDTELDAETFGTITTWFSFDQENVTVTGSELKAIKAGSAEIQGFNEANAKVVSLIVSVIALEESSIEITEPTKKVYNSGEALDESGITVTIIYNNGNKEPTTNFTVTPDDPTVDKSQMRAGEHKFWVNYGKFKESFTVSVNEVYVLSIEVVNDKDFKTKYEVGDSFIVTRVRVNYSDGKHDVIVSGYEVVPEIAAKGITSFTVKYRGEEAVSPSITVTEKESGGGSGGGSGGSTDTTYKLSLATSPSKKSYVVGDLFDQCFADIPLKQIPA